MNHRGQCGQPTSIASFVAEPTAVKLPASSPHALQASCGAEHCACVTTCGAILCWGCNSFNQLGQLSGSAHAHHQPICPILNETSNASLSRGFLSISFWQVACGEAHTVALTSDSRGAQVYTWGSNTYGQCGREQPPPPPENEANNNNNCAPADAVQIAAGVCVWRAAAGAHFTLLVTSAGVLSFGANGFGQLGRETETPHDYAPAPVDLACLAADGSGSGSGRGCVRDVSCGDQHSLSSRMLTHSDVC